MLDALEDALQLPRGGLKDSRSILRDYGNMSAVTVLFVAERMDVRNKAQRTLADRAGPWLFRRLSDAGRPRAGDDVIWIAYAIIALVVLQRAGELVLANRNTQKLKAQGAVEIGADHYRFIVLLHMAWLMAVLWLLPAPLVIHWGWIAVFVLLQAARDLGDRQPGALLDHAHHFAARRAAGQARTLSLRAPSQLSGGGG